MPDDDVVICFNSADEFLNHVEKYSPGSDGVLLSNLYMLGSDLGGEGTGALIGKAFVIGCWERRKAPALVFDGCRIDGDALWGLRKAIFTYAAGASEPPSIYFVNADINTRKIASGVLGGICRVWFATNGLKKIEAGSRTKAVSSARPALSITSIGRRR